MWPAGPGCPGGPGARLDVIEPGAGPAAPHAPLAGAPLAPLSAAAAPQGQIAIAGADPRRRGSALLLEGHAGGGFRVLAADGAAPGAALASAYLGDLALLARARGALVLAVQRWFGGPPRPPRKVAATPEGPPPASTVALDYRSDAIAAWARGGAVWARALPAGGRAPAAQRLGPAGAGTRIAALLSDDDRAIVMWSTYRAGRTDVYLDQSAPGPRFTAARLIEAAPDPGGLRAPGGSPALVRLSSESVMCAWTGVSEGRWAVRTAPIDQLGLRHVSTIAAAGADLALSALAPGPRGEAVALLGETPAGGGASALLAARGIDAAPGRTLFGAPERITPAGWSGPVSSATVAIEPGADRAFAAWRGAGEEIYYSLDDPGPPG